MSKLLGNLRQGIPFVISAPAGTGKTTLVRRLANEFPCVVESISCTTRKRRPGEIDGVHYHFLSEEELARRVATGEFLEHAVVFGDTYGTSASFVMEQLKSGHHVFLVIDTQGALQLMGKWEAVFIFLSPPNLAELRNRLVKRRTEAPSAIEERLNWAEKELEAIPRYDYHIINDDLNVAYQVLRSIVVAEEHRVKHKDGGILSYGRLAKTAD